MKCYFSLITDLISMTINWRIMFLWIWIIKFLLEFTLYWAFTILKTIFNFSSVDVHENLFFKCCCCNLSYIANSSSLVKKQPILGILFLSLHYHFKKDRTVLSIFRPPFQANLSHALALLRACLKQNRLSSGEAPIFFQC